MGNNIETNSLILAAGFGTRMGLSPKGLIELEGGHTILGRMLDDLFRISNIKNIALTTNSLFHKRYQEWINKTGFLDRIKIIDNGRSQPENRLGALGDLAYVLDQLDWWSGADLMVLPSDTVYNFSLEEFHAFSSRKSGLSVAVYKADRTRIHKRLGCVQLEGDKVFNFEEKPENPKSDFAIAPFYYFPQSYLDSVRGYVNHAQGDLSMLDAPSQIITWFMAQNLAVYAFRTDLSVIDVGTPPDITQTNLLIQASG